MGDVATGADGAGWVLAPVHAGTTAVCVEAALRRGDRVGGAAPGPGVAWRCALGSERAGDGPVSALVWAADGEGGCLGDAVLIGQVNPNPLRVQLSFPPPENSVHTC